MEFKNHKPIPKPDIIFQIKWFDTEIKLLKHLNGEYSFEQTKDPFYFEPEELYQLAEAILTEAILTEVGDIEK